MVTPYRDEDLKPLLDHLRQDPAVDRETVFPCGTLLPDGRLDLCKQGLGPRGTTGVVDALQGRPFVSSLLLGANALGDDGATAVARLLPDNPELTTVFLGCNGIGPQGVEALARHLAARPNLRGLWLKRNPLGHDGIETLAKAVAVHPSLRTLDLVHTETRGRGLKALVDGLIEHNRSLERLFLDANDLDAEDAEQLARLIRAAGPLRELYIDNNRLGDAGARIVSEAMAEVSRRRSDAGLRILGLAGNGLGEAGFRAVAGLLAQDPPLRRLFIGKGRSAAVYRTVANRGSTRAADELLHALETNTHLERIVLGSGFPRGREIRAVLGERARMSGTVYSLPDDLLAVRSVYRTPPKLSNDGNKISPPAVPPTTVSADASPTGPQGRESGREQAPNLSIPAPSAQELATCERVLEILRRRPDLFFDGAPDGDPDPDGESTKDRLRKVRAAANRVVHAIQEESRRRKTRRGQGRRGQGRRGKPPTDRAASRQRNRERDRGLVATTGIRTERAAAVRDGRREPPRQLTGGDPASAESLAHDSLAHGRTCHICRERYRRLHRFYDALCPTCAELNLAKRRQTTDLTGRVAILTGGRIKIGHQIALKLLRAGATVHMTTRFPCAAAKRFAAYEDFPQWRERLHIVGIDLRRLPAVEDLADAWADLPRLDFLIQNAAQTIRRPPAFYAPLQADEQAGPRALPAEQRTLIDQDLSLPDCAVPSAKALLPEDRRGALFFPGDGRQEDGQPLDLRPRNSWSLELGEVSTLELLEVQVINAMAPFVLLGRLRPLLLRTYAETAGHPGVHAVSVSAMEGSFSRPYKNSTHPHTNMAKASLNMLTRTCGPALAKKGVYLNSVDTGWVTDEQPYPTRRRIQERLDFEPPLDEVDGAARVLDPIFSGLRQGGLFWKNYRPVDW